MDGIEKPGEEPGRPEAAAPPEAATSPEAATPRQAATFPDGDPLAEAATPPDRTASFRWWVRMQIGFGLTGGVVWLGGAAMERDFVSGAGLGLLIAALVLRIGRRSTADAPWREKEG